ncbi:hypothetical protein Dimus_025301 [Dionaea muscipula]
MSNCSMSYLSLVFAYHHLFTTVIVAISTSAYVSALHSHLHFFHQARSTCHHHLLETPSSRQEGEGCEHHLHRPRTASLHATITETTPTSIANHHHPTFVSVADHLRDAHRRPLLPSTITGREGHRLHPPLEIPTRRDAHPPP